TKMLGGDVFERMGLVENRDLIFGQEAGALGTEREIAEEQRVVDDKQMRSMNPFAGLEVETLIMISALTAETVVAVGFDQVPDHRGWLKIEIALAAVAGLSGPVVDPR